MAIIVLQYPDPVEGRLKMLASTRDRKALLAFREAVLGEARARALESYTDEVLRIDYEKDLERLEQILDLLIPLENNEDA